MIKVMIVDDEFYIREGLKKSDLWDELALDFVGEAEDGAMAWELYQIIKPDIILLDINIPRKNGMELARDIRADNEDIQFIFLTGYDEFELMKEAISLQASDYLLKPVIRDDLYKALQKAKNQVVKRENQHQSLDHLRKQVISYSKAAYEQWMIELLQQRRPLEECLSLLATIGIHFDEDSYYAVICNEMDDFQSPMEHVSARDRQLYQYAFRKLAEEALESFEDVHILSDSTCRVIVWVGGPINDGDDDLTEIAKRLRHVFSEYLKTQVSIGISSKVKGVGQVNKAYLEALRAVEYKALVGCGQTIPYSSIHVTVSQDNHLLNKELYLLSEMRAGNEVNVVSILQEWSEELRGMSWSDVKLVASHLVLFVMRLFKEVGFPNQVVSHANPLIDLDNCRTIGELLGFMNAYFAEVSRIIRQSKEAPAHKMIEQAKAWIRGHLSEDLSLVNLAQYLNISPKYLSMRFKQATGETFGEFSTRIRFERAKELLMDPSLKILDTAIQVGFIDTNYFSMAFKKHIGITPTEYRKRFL